MIKRATFKRRGRQLLSLLVTAGACCCANAAVEALNGTFGFTPIGDLTYSGPDLQQATSVTFPALEVVNTVPAAYNGNANDFATGASSVPLGSFITINNGIGTLTLPAVQGVYTPSIYPNFLGISNGTTPSDRFDFNLLELMRTSSGSSSLDIYGMGILHDRLGIFSDTPGVIAIAFTQAGQGGAVNASFSVASTAVPEPGTLIAGVCALGFVLLCTLASSGKVRGIASC
jgi:hypothetical protein